MLILDNTSIQLRRNRMSKEIIRCKDCKYYEIWEMKSGKDGYTDDKRYKPSVCTIGEFAVHRDENWFCADAKRKTE